MAVRTCDHSAYSVYYWEATVNLHQRSTIPLAFVIAGAPTPKRNTLSQLVFSPCSLLPDPQPRWFGSQPVELSVYGENLYGYQQSCRELEPPFPCFAPVVRPFLFTVKSFLNLSQFLRRDLKCLGLAIFLPSSVTKRLLSPTSKPTDFTSGEMLNVGVVNQSETCQRPPGQA